MNEMNCEIFLMAKMAELDGEETKISAEVVNSHLLICENCRMEFEQMRNTHDSFNRQMRREQKADLWSAIEERIGAQPVSPINWQPFILLGVVLISYKLLEMLSRQDLGLAFKIVPLIFAVVLFAFLKENPFKINAELGLER